MPFAKPDLPSLRSLGSMRRCLFLFLTFTFLDFNLENLFYKILQEMVWRLQLQPPWSWPLRFCRPGRICWYLYLPIIIPTAFVALDFFTAPTMILFQLCRRTRHYDAEHCTCKACKKRDISLVCQAWVDYQSVEITRRCFHFFFSRSRWWLSKKMTSFLWILPYYLDLD